MIECPQNTNVGAINLQYLLTVFFISDDDNAMSSKTERISFKGFLRSSVNLVEIYHLTFKSNYEFAMLGLLTNSNDNQQL